MSEFKGITIERFDDRDKIESSSYGFLTVAGETAPIETNEQYENVAGLLKEAKAFIKEADGKCAPRIKQAQDLHKSLLADLKALIAPAEQSVSMLNKLLIAYDNKLERERQAERVRLEQERVKAEAEAKKKAEEEKIDTAILFEQHGMPEEAEAVLNQPVRVAPATVAPIAEKPKIQGLSYRETWKAEMTAQSIDDVDPRFVKKVFDQDMANAYAKSNKDGAKAKGIRFYADKTPITRR
ncbi:MAG: hypothetical protein OEY89_02490 [Gammaproteobacteria bacterium]|nr:hypothetical protein [Gammaproteobacteria bacterium]